MGEVGHGMNTNVLMVRPNLPYRVYLQRRRVRAARLVMLVIIAILVAIIIWMSLGLISVKGNSMLPSMLDGDTVLYLKGSFMPDRGDIIIIESGLAPSGKIVKRVVGLPGDKLQIDSTGHVTINGVPLTEEYALFGVNYNVEANGETATLEVAQGCVLVLGDNRAVSHDSRFEDVGFIQSPKILGRAILVLRSVE